LIHGHADFVLFGLTVSDTSGSDGNISPIAKPIYSLACAEFFFATGQTDIWPETPIADNAKASFMDAHVFGGLLGPGEATVVESSGYLASGATDHSQSTAMATICALKLVAEKLV